MFDSLLYCNIARRYSIRTSSILDRNCSHSLSAKESTSALVHYLPWWRCCCCTRVWRLTHKSCNVCLILAFIVFRSCTLVHLFRNASRQSLRQLWKMDARVEWASFSSRMTSSPTAIWNRSFFLGAADRLSWRTLFVSRLFWPAGVTPLLEPHNPRWAVAAIYVFPKRTTWKTLVETQYITLPVTGGARSQKQK